MHILVINDDGPPSQKASPYIHSFIHSLQTSGNVVSVILPHQQRSWIGKAHFVALTVKPTYYRPGTLHQDDGTIEDWPSELKNDWVLVNGTPATCAQLGLFHFFQDRGPVDLVISGPNYGRNCTSVFSLSSGTLGGAMEAAMCQKKAIALSFAYKPGEHDPQRIAGACRHSIKLIQYLYENWAEDADLYSINVPLIDGVEDHKIMYTNTLQNHWSSGSSFQQVDTIEDESPESRENEIRQMGETKSGDPQRSGIGHEHRYFKWAPKFSDVYNSIDDSLPGNDGWAIKEQYTSVTPLRANFMHASSIRYGELKLSSNCQNGSPEAYALRQTPRFYAFINYEDPYVQPLILKALSTITPSNSYVLISSLSSLPSPISPLLQITSYETLDFDHLLKQPTTSLANAYIIRKALIRKHFLAYTISAWNSKQPNNPLMRHVRPTVYFELDYSEFLDEALLEAYELYESFARNATLPPECHEWWILKPGMSDRGQGIQLFSSEAHLRSIFEQWDYDSESESDSSSTEIRPPGPDAALESRLITSHLRHFVAQPYIHLPLLLPQIQSRKFHLRTYVLAVGAIRVYIHHEPLALFAPLPYAPPSYPFNPAIHLTNTCLRASADPHSVMLFSTMPKPSHLPHDWKAAVMRQIETATAELFLAAVRTQSTHFQPLPNAFEIFGVDWLIDAKGGVWLLEVNAFPDFAQGGSIGEGVVRGVWEGVVGVVLGEGGFFGEKKQDGSVVGDESWGMKMVLDVDLGRR